MGVSLPMGICVFKCILEAGSVEQCLIVKCIWGVRTSRFWYESNIFGLLLWFCLWTEWNVLLVVRVLLYRSYINGVPQSCHSTCQNIVKLLYHQQGSYCCCFHTNAKLCCFLWLEVNISPFLLLCLDFHSFIVYVGWKVFIWGLHLVIYLLLPCT